MTESGLVLLCHIRRSGVLSFGEIAQMVIGNFKIALLIGGIALGACTKPTPSHNSVEMVSSSESISHKDEVAEALSGTATRAQVAPDPKQSGQPRNAPSTFAGEMVPVTTAVLDFENSTQNPDLGRIAAVRLQTGLSGQMFEFVERSQLRRLLVESDLGASGIVDTVRSAEAHRLVGTRFIILGSVSGTAPVVIAARVVDCETGRIARQASFTASSEDDIEDAIASLAAVLSASDFEYDMIRNQSHARTVNQLDEEKAQATTVVRDGVSLIITVRLSTIGRREPEVYQNARQRIREAFTTYCQTKLNLAESKDWLMDYCRDHELCEDVIAKENYKDFTYRVPLPLNTSVKE